ncbi:hypothetical protein FA95DRAFT_1566384 [Auriscalpium vulgare]|uniref:Uncharacterized protein n=1 Tax=Auriscalpium vulgare TaxID=40419 RepID=A0ACB8R8F2_9AGAM|nr:hypothetical protein FA95DRAFT_1566384 [Auriscalpium vulgare]
MPFRAPNARSQSINPVQRYYRSFVQSQGLPGMADHLNLSPSSKWESIRPWNPRLSLSVREITSVSATFAVTSLLSSRAGLSHLLDRDASDADDDPSAEPSSTSTSSTSALAKGLSVKVNGTPWQRVLARIDDAAEEAVLIIYGLMPGRQYDIEIGVIAGEARVHGQIVTEGSGDGRDRTRSNASSVHEIPEVNIFSSTAIPIDPSPSPPSPSPPATPPSPSSEHPTIEEYFASLKTTLVNLKSEHETLSTALKSARRDSQKSQAAVRSEITSLKRATQKHSTGDSRMRQKVRALEEAVKQAVKGREDVEAEFEDVEAERIKQEGEMSAIERRRDEVRTLAEEGQRRREHAETEADGKVQTVKAELAAVDAKLEKLHARREKLDGRAGSSEEEADEASKPEEPDDDEMHAILGGVVGDLEAKLREMQLERERIESDPFGYLAATTPSPHAHTPDSEDAVPDAPPADVPPRFQSGAHAQHPRTHQHHQQHSSGTHFSRGGKRHAPFSPAHTHSHSHPPRGAATLPPANSGAAAAQVRGQAAPRHFARAAQGQGHGGTPAGASRAPMSRRASSPPPLAERSTLSSLAPPFEPAYARGNGKGPGRAGER